MDNLVLKIEDLPLSGDDLIDIANCLGADRVKWMLYDDLDKIENVDQLFGQDFDSVYLLLQIRDPSKNSTVGHWVCFIYHRERNEYYWHDPYGLKIIQDLSFTHEPDHIIKLTKNLSIEENTHRHQEFRDTISTCGRHCCLRSVFYHLDPEEYHNLVIKPVVPSMIKKADHLVALITGLSSQTDRPLITFFNKKEK